MTKYLNKLLLLSVLLYSFACQQENRDPYRERHQSSVQEEPTEVPAEEEEEAPVEEEAATPAETNTDPAERKPSTTAGDKVVAVKDGDTMDLLRNGQVIKVRLYGIDSPEKNQAYGQRAKQYASDLAFGKYVKLIPHNTDRYGRTVGTIILPDGRSLNEEMVRNGFAWHYKAYSKDKNLENLETDARRFKRGLWNDPNPTPPWDFRKEKRTGQETESEEDSAPATTTAAAPGSNRKVYICDSKGATVYHVTSTCSVLKRCKAEVLTVTEKEAIQKYDRRVDKTCGS